MAGLMLRWFRRSLLLAACATGGISSLLAQVSITTAGVPPGTAGHPYSVTIFASGGSGSYTWSITSGGLPPGLGLNPFTGVVSGIPAAGFSTSATIRVESGSGIFSTSDSRTFSFAVAPPPVITTGSLLPAATATGAYFKALQATGGTNPRQWTLAGGVPPPGLTLTSSTGVLSGSPSTSGSFGFTVRLADGVGADTLRSFSLTVNPPPTIANPLLPTATVNVPYSVNLLAADGTGPFTWSLISGSLPPGLALDTATGALSGTATSTFSGSLGFQVRDANLVAGVRHYLFTVGITASVPGMELLPERTELLPNFPNPFNPATTIGFTLVKAEFTTVKVFDLLGREVATLVEEVKAPGTHRVTFDAAGLASGVYLCRMEAGALAWTRPMVLNR